MKLTINELRQLVKEELKTLDTIGGNDDENVEAGMTILQQKIVELEKSLTKAFARIKRLQIAQRTDEKDKTEEKTAEAAGEATDILGDLDLGGE